MEDLFKTKKEKIITDEKIILNFVFIDTQASFEKHLPAMLELPYWVVDTETTGTDFICDEVILLQLGNKDIQYLIDTRYVDISALKERLESENFKKFLQNAVFDYLMIQGSKKIVMEDIYCTMIAEQLLLLGIQKYGFSLEDLCLKYLGIHIDKKMQTSFIGHPRNKPFSWAQKRYAAFDIYYVDLVAQIQLELLKEQELLEVFKLECRAIPAFGDIEFFGLHLDTEAWERNIIKARAESDAAREEFLSCVSKYVPKDLFGQPAINPASASQVLEYFEKRFPIDDLKDRDGKVGTGGEILESLVEKYHNTDTDVTDVKALMKIREKDKLASTYGYSYIKAIHPLTKRFHPKLKQIGTETGRPAGKKPNMLNIPALADYRHPWSGGPGTKTITDDYGACELRIMASDSEDPVMCEGFNKGLDYHTYTAGEFIADPNPYKVQYFPHPKEPGKGSYGDFILDSNGNKIPNEKFGVVVGYDFVTKVMRTIAKTINFGLAYGMGAGKLAVTLAITLELSKEYIKKFNDKFKVLIGWLRGNQESALIPKEATYKEKMAAKKEGREPRLTLGYAKTSLGRKRYFEIPKAPYVVEHGQSFVKRYYKDQNTGEVKVSWKSEKLGMDLDYDPLNPWDANIPEVVKKYYTRIAAIKREAGNSPIQGANADITKIAMYMLRKEIKKFEKERNNGEYVAHIGLQVYDEIILVCKEEYAEEFRVIMDDAMRAAGEVVIKNVPVEVGGIIADSWVKG